MQKVEGTWQRVLTNKQMITVYCVTATDFLALNI